MDIHSKSEKVCGTAFSVKKNCGKSAGYFWAILGHSWAILGHFGPFRGIFGQICGKFKFFCGPVGVMGLAFRMYGLTQD